MREKNIVENKNIRRKILWGTYTITSLIPIAARKWNALSNTLETRKKTIRMSNVAELLIESLSIAKLCTEKSATSNGSTHYRGNAFQFVTDFERFSMSMVFSLISF